MSGLMLRICVAASVLAGAGCAATVQSGGFIVDKWYMERAIEAIKPRAAFELECPPEQLQFTVLHVYAKTPQQIGVSGCAARLVYVRPHHAGQWMLNSDSRPDSPTERARQGSARDP